MQVYNPQHPAPSGGAFRDRHIRGAGCGGRGSVRRGRSGQGGVLRRGTVRSGHRVDDDAARTAKACGPGAPREHQARWRVRGNRRGTPSTGSDGDEKPCRPPGRARHKPLTPSRAERRVASRCDRGQASCALTTYAHEPMGASGTRRSARPLDCEMARECSTPRAHRRRGIARTCAV